MELTWVSAKSSTRGRPRFPSGAGLTLPVSLHVDKNRYTVRRGIPVRCEIVFASRPASMCMKTSTPRRSSENATPLVIENEIVQRSALNLSRSWSWSRLRPTAPPHPRSGSDHNHPAACRQTALCAHSHCILLARRCLTIICWT